MTTPPPGTNNNNNNNNNNPPANNNTPANHNTPAHNNTPANPAAAKAAGPTAATIASWKARLADFYKTLIRGKSSPPAALWKLYLESKGDVSPDRLTEWVRKNDAAHYKDSQAFYDRVNSLSTTLKTLLGQDYKAVKDMPKLLTQYGLAAPKQNDDAVFFGKVVKKSKSFAKQFQGFDEWFALAQHTNLFKSSLEAAAAFVTAKATLETKYRDAMKTNIVDESFILAALKGNWDDTQFTLNLTSGDAWKTTMGKPRDEEFKRNWDSIFAGTKEEGKYNEAMMSKYRLGSMDFATFVNTDLKDTLLVHNTFPEYRAWSDKQTKLGVAEDSINITSYLAAQGAAREAYGALYKEMLGLDGATVPAEMLKRATEGNWSDTLFKQFVKEHDPAYRGTIAYQNDTQSFDLYWKDTFGENSVPDQSLRDLYAIGSYQQPNQLFDKIKNTNEFKSQYGNWDAFSAGQKSAGKDAMTDPLLYNEYKTAFYNAFADAGLQMPLGPDGQPLPLERQFLASGDTTTDFTQHVGQFAQTKEAYGWQSGEQADVATATDLVDKTQGGVLRKKMQDALAQQKAYLNSNAAPTRTQDTQGSGLTTIKI